MGDYKHTVWFSPRGVPLHDASDRRTITFCSDSLSREKTQRHARRRAVEGGHISPYALRNHWEIAEMEAQFAETPWHSYAELGEYIIGFPGARDYGRGQRKLSEENKLFVTVTPEEMDAFLEAAAAYFAPLNPRRHRRGTAVLTINPDYWR